MIRVEVKVVTTNQRADGTPITAVVELETASTAGNPDLDGQEARRLLVRLAADVEHRLAPAPPRGQEADS